VKIRIKETNISMFSLRYNTLNVIHTFTNSVSPITTIPAGAAKYSATGLQTGVSINENTGVITSSNTAPATVARNVIVTARGIGNYSGTKTTAAIKVSIIRKSLSSYNSVTYAALIVGRGTGGGSRYPAYSTSTPLYFFIKVTLCMLV
jgi:hypothetical protein